MKYEWKVCSKNEFYSLFIGKRKKSSATIRKTNDRYIWHTWDKNNIGGENSICDDLDIAKRIALGSVIMQGFV